MLESKTQKVAFNTIFQIVGKVVTTVLSLAAIAYLTRYLGISSYGEYTTIFAYVSFAAVIADFGFYWILIREIAMKEHEISRIFNNIITLKIVFSIVVFTLSALVAFLIPEYSLSLKIGISIISVSMFWMSLNSTYVGLFQNRLEMYKSVISDIAGRVVITALVIYLIKMNLGLDLILWVYVFGNFINFLISYLFGRKHIKFALSFDFPYWKSMLVESMPLAILNFIGIINFKIDTIILSIMKSQADVGIYGVPYKILEIIITIPSIFVGNTFPILTKYFYEKDGRMQNAIQRSFDFLVLIAFPVVAGLIVLSNQIVRLIAGKDYVLASTVKVAGIAITAPQILGILAISVGITFIITLFSSLVTVAGKQSKQVVPIGVVTSVNIILNLLFIPKFSYFAASFSNIISGLMLLVWWNKLAHKYLEFKLDYKIIYKSLFATLIMSLALFPIKEQNVLITVPLGIVVYFVVAYLVKAITKDALKELLPRKIDTTSEDI